MRSAFWIALGVLALAACDGESTTPAAVAESAQLPADQVIYGLRHNMTTDGVRSGELLSDSAYMFETGRKLDLKGVRLRFFAENGRETGVLTSSSGEYHTGTGSFVARGDVLLITHAPSRRLETEELHYDVEGDQLWSDVPFVLREGERVTRGTRFRSDSRFETWSVSNAETSGGLPRTGGGGVSF